MAYKVQITDSAKIELAEIIEYISETLCNKNAASSLLDDFYEQKRFLYENPYTFPECPIESLRRKGYRQFLFKKNYVALYLVDDEENKKEVTIMHVFYAKRDYEKLV